MTRRFLCPSCDNAVTIHVKAWTGGGEPAHDHEIEAFCCTRHTKPVRMIEDTHADD